MAIQISSNQIKPSNIITSLIANDAVTAAKLDQSGTYDFSSGAVSVAAPTQDAHAATKQYVDNLANGQNWKKPARVKTTGAISGTYNNGSSGVGATLTNGSNGAVQIDGVSLSLEDRVLVANQAADDAEQNGIYEVTTVGDSSNPFVLTRANDADTTEKLRAATLWVEEGSANADSQYVLTSDNVTIGTDDIIFVQSNGGGQLNGGDGILKNGNTLSVDLDTDSGMEFNSAKLRVKLDGATLDRTASGMKVADSGIGSSQLAASAVTSAKISSGAVGTSALAAASVTSAKVADGAISSAAKLSDGVVETAKLADGAVTAVKLAANSVTAAKLNSDLAGAGLGLNSGDNALEVIADESSLEVSGDAIQIKDLGVTTAKLQASAVTAAKLASSSVTSDKLGSASVTSAKLAANSVTAAKLNSDLAGAGLGLNSGDNALEVIADETTIEVSGDAIQIKDLGVGTAKLVANCVTSAKLANGAVGTNQLAANAVTSAKLADGAVSTTAKLADGIVTTAKIGDGEVSAAKLKDSPVFETFVASGSQTDFDLGGAIDSANSDAIKVFRNGLRMKKVASSPSGKDEYTVAPTGGAGGVCRISFGSSPDANDDIFVDSLQ